MKQLEHYPVPIAARQKCAYLRKMTSFRGKLRIIEIIILYFSVPKNEKILIYSALDIDMDKGSKFLTKLWCYIGSKYYKIIFFID